MTAPNGYVPPGPLDSAPGGGFQPREVRAAAFAELLAGVELGDYDRRMIAWLTGLDDSTCRAFASIMWRCLLSGIPGVARVRTELPADSLRMLAADMGSAAPDDPAALAVTAVRNLARYAPDGKRVRMWIEWDADRPRVSPGAAPGAL